MMTTSPQLIAFIPPRLVWPGALMAMAVVAVFGCAPVGPAEGEGLPGSGSVAKGDTASAQGVAGVYCDSSGQGPYGELILMYPNTDGSGFHRGSFRRISKLERPANALDPSTRVVEYGEYGADSEQGHLALEIQRVEVWREATQETEPQSSSGEATVEQWSYELSDAGLSITDDAGTTMALSKSSESDCGLLDLPLPGTGSAEGMVRIEPGMFLMGSLRSEPGRAGDEVEHEVTLRRAFYLGATEVTQGEWRERMEINPSHFSDCGDNCPVESVSWFHAIAYANAVSREQNLSECYTSTGEVDRANTPSGSPYDLRGLPSTDRGGVGVRESRGNADGVLQRWHHGHALRRHDVGRDRLVLRQLRRTHAACWDEAAECVGPVRHGGQRAGMDRGLVRRLSLRFGHRSHGSRGRLVPGGPRWAVVRLRGDRSRGASPPRRPRRPHRGSRLPPRQVGAVGAGLFPWPLALGPLVAWQAFTTRKRRWLEGPVAKPGLEPPERTESRGRMRCEGGCKGESPLPGEARAA